jgi:serine/threonine-protein kinase RsbW/sigma-B regulation protein RsbU (phosphoserine phosphatase)
MKDVERFEGPARMTALGDFLGFVEAACARAGVSHDATLRMVLIVEELLTNTVEHGHGRDVDEPVRLALHRDGMHAVLEYEDTAPAFDPLAAARQADAQLDERVSARLPGGVGLSLIAHMAQEARYERRDGRNCLCLRLSCQDSV